MYEVDGALDKVFICEALKPLIQYHGCSKVFGRRGPQVQAGCVSSFFGYYEGV